MATFKKTHVRAPATRFVEKQTRDTLFWKNYEFPVTKKEFGPVTCVDFSPVAPYTYAVSSSVKVQLYSPLIHLPDRKLSTFKKEVRSGKFRSDGKLVVAGGDEGVVKVFEVEGRSLLRTYRGHTDAVHYVNFTRDNVRVVSCSNDETVRLWDLGGQSLIRTYSEHKDYVRCGSCPNAAPELFLSGSYDKTAKLYDLRTEASVLSVDHEAPIEDVLMFPGGTLFATAGGNSVKIWDVARGGRLLVELNNHHKTVTCLTLANDNQRLLSGSLDGNVKVYDIATYQSVHTMDYPAPVMCMALSKGDEYLAVGMSTGILSVQKKKPAEEEAMLNKIRQKRPNFRHGKVYQPTPGAAVVEHRTKEKLAQYDKFFKRFEHSKALDAALEVNIRRESPEVTVGVLQELIRRNALHAALAGRDEKSLVILLRFFTKYLARPQFASTLTDVFNILLDIYGPKLGESPTVDNLFRRVQAIVDLEVKCMMGMLQTMGSLDTLFAVSARRSGDSKQPAGDSLASLTTSASVANQGPLNVPAVV